MNQIKLGRNDPCFCGSGKKFKKCCLLSTHLTEPTPAETVSENLVEALNAESFSSIKEAQHFTERFSVRTNSKPSDDFQGISPEQMHCLVYYPFESPTVISFNENVIASDNAPIMKLFRSLISAIGEKGLKATAKGNLPQKFCREAALIYWGEQHAEKTRWRSINKEEDFLELNVVRIITELAGLIKKYRGKFIVSPVCRKQIKNEGITSLYMILFKTFMQKYNWGYWDGHSDLPFIQDSFAFTLYLLTVYAKERRDISFYSECYLKAFPTLKEEIEPTNYSTVEERLRQCYELRTFTRFAKFFGLIEMSRASKDLFDKHQSVVATPLLNKFIQFRV